MAGQGAASPYSWDWFLSMISIHEADQGLTFYIRTHDLRNEKILPSAEPCKKKKM